MAPGMYWPFPKPYRPWLMSSRRRAPAMSPWIPSARQRRREPASTSLENALMLRARRAVRQACISSQAIEAMAGDQQSLVGWNNEGLDAACGTGDARAASGIGGYVKLHAEPRRILQNPAPDLGRMFADASREDQRIEPAERGGERAKFAADAIDEKRDRFRRARILGGEQRPHVVADAGNTQQPRLIVEKIAHGFRIHFLLVEKIKHDSRIEGAATPAHRKAIERGKAHGRRDAFAIFHGTHAGAAAKMGNHDPAHGGAGA